MRLFPALIFFVVFVSGWTAHAEDSTDAYRITVEFFVNADRFSSRERCETWSRQITDRCQTLAGGFWDVRVRFSDADASEESIQTRITDPKSDWASQDKLFAVKPDPSGLKLRMREWDIKTRWDGTETVYEIDHPDKLVDTVVRAMFELFSPLARIEKATSDSATIRCQGTLPPAWLRLKEGDVLLPFVRTLGRDGELLDVSRISWTALIVESIDSRTGLLRCRLATGVRDPLGSRRRGRTELLAIRIPTPMEPTTLHLEARTPSTASRPSTVMPFYDVFESLPGEAKPQLIGRTCADGSFVLEPDRDRPVRVCLIKSGRSIIAQVPVVRGLEKELSVPVPDDSVRLEVEAALLGLQEEWIDTVARRKILKLRLAKFEQKGDGTMAQETRNELAKLKENERFLIELQQIRLRFHSGDPIVQRRIDRMLRSMEAALTTPE